MNAHHTNVTGPAADPEAPGTAARIYPGIRSGSPAGWFSGIRSSGQYCRPRGLKMTGLRVTAPRMISGRYPVHGMCP